MTQTTRRLRDADLTGQLEYFYQSSTTSHITAAPYVAGTVMKMPFHGIVSLSADGNPITLRSGGRTFEYRSIAFCSRELEFMAAATPFVAICINPLHENFRLFARLRAPYVLPLDRADFAPLDALLRKAVDGTLTVEESTTLVDGVQAIVRPKLPRVKADWRAQTIMRELWANPRCSIDELASRLGLSYHRTSHVFAEAVGIPLRTYVLWQKLYRAGGFLLDGATMTEAAHAAGFSDSAHYSSAFHRAYGRAPSEMFKSRRVCISAPELVRKARTSDSLQY